MGHNQGMRPWHDPAWRAECARGARDLMPAVPGTFAWGLVTGVAMVKSGLTIPLALVMTLFVYAGSAQLASLPLIASAAPAWVIAATAFATNMRFVIYAAAMRQHLAIYGKRRLAVLGYLSGDFPFVYFMNRIARDGAFPHRDAWKFGLAATNWVVWQVSSILGIVGAAFIPTEWGLQFAGTLALLPLVLPACRSWAGASGALTAGCVALLGNGWPYKSGLLVGVVAGIVAATAVDNFTSSQRENGRP